MIKQYCTVLVSPRLLSSGLPLKSNRERHRICKLNRHRDKEGKPVKFNTVADAVNYMGEDGRQLVNAFPVTTGKNTYTYHNVFRRLFLKSDLAER